MPVLALLVLWTSQTAVAETYHLPLLPSAADPSRQGIVRIVNHSATAGDVTITAIDDSARYFGPVTLTLESRTAIQFSSSDLEQGNEALGIIGGIGSGQGHWRLVLDSDLDIEPLAYAETSAGFIDSIHDTVPRRSFYHRVALSAPDSLQSQGGTLRLINLSYSTAEIAVFGLDDSGHPVSGQVVLSLPPGTSRSISASELENGAPGLIGRLGDGEGNWRLLVFSDSDLHIAAMTLLDIPSGPLANLSMADYENGEIAFFPSTAELSRTGELRIASRSGPGEVVIYAIDETGQRFAPVTLILEAERTVTLDSHDLETGNTVKGLPTGLGRGEGDWRLRLESDLDLDVFSYARTQDGVVTVVGQVAEASDRRHHVPIFKPAHASEQLSRLRLINPGADSADVRIQGWDDAGHIASSGVVTLSLQPGTTHTISATALEEGADDLNGSLGQGEGNWRLLVEADRDIRVMSLVENFEGHTTNLSSTSNLPRFLMSCFGGPVDSDNDGISDHCDTDPHTALRPLRACADGSFVDSPGLLPGLVSDCPVLIGFANYQAQSDSLPDDHALRHWGFGAQERINDWSGIDLSFLGLRVTEIRLRGPENQPGGLTGSIPPQLGALTELTKLDLAYNQLSGSIPPELGQLANLTDLFLANNGLTGSIPPELGQLASLRQLWLAENQLTGPLPPKLGELSRLTYLGIWSNQLTGPIPSQFGQLVNVAWFQLQRNQLSGHIPPELGQLSRLEYLSLGGNRLTGRIPSELGQLSLLTELWLNSNGLAGPIPPELGSLLRLTQLQLWGNQLSGPIPPELGNLTELQKLALSGNQLTGVIPPELGRLDQLEYLSVSRNRLAGSIPWTLWERVRRGELEMNYASNSILGVAGPPQRSRPVYLGTPANNGNATHHSVSYYQGPLTWEWNWTGDAVEHQRPLLGRWASLAVRVDHEVATPPLVTTRVLDGAGWVLVERLREAARPKTISTGSGRWRTEYVFELPGEFYQTGNQLVHIIDPYNDLAETDEEDNIGTSIRLYGERPPPFRVTFIPLHAPGEEPPSDDPLFLMAGTWAYLPIGDDFQAVLGPPLKSNAADKFELLDEVRALWNAQADSDEFYHGVFRSPWPGSGDWNDRIGGVAAQAGRVGVSTISPHYVIPHEFGHNFDLLHPPGCNAGNVDERYPYPEGSLGPHPGWDVNWRRLVSRDDDGYADVMSYCRTHSFISDYHYRRASDYWLAAASAKSSRAVQPLISRVSPRGLGPANQSPPGAGNTAALNTDHVAALALSGRIRATGTWSLTHAQRTEKGPRPPAPDGEFTLILLDLNGAELYREPLARIISSEGGEAGWAARIPIPERTARQVLILDSQGVAVLRANLPPLD